MKTVLLGWELGAGRGYVEAFAPLIRSYLAAGWSVVAAMRDVELARQTFGSANAKLTITQAPLFYERRPKFGSAISLPAIFCNIGFDDPELTVALISSWERILVAHEPDVVVSNFAPNLNMAARNRIPVIAVGTGWTIPPAIDPLPPFPMFTMLEDRIRPYSEHIVASVNHGLGAGRKIYQFSDYLRGDVNVVCAMPKLDPYNDCRDEPYYWPLNIPVLEKGNVAVRGGGLVYLWAEHPARDLIETAAPRFEIELKAYFGGQTYEGISNLTVSPSPINFVEEIPHARLMIHHGGLGTAIWCIAHQVPQLICADDLEKRLIAEAVISARCGGMFRPEIALDQFVDLAARVAKLNVPVLNISPMATVCPASTMGYILDQPPS